MPRLAPSAGLLAVIVLAGGCSTRPSKGTNANTAKPAVDPWPAAVAALRKQTDAATCRQALAQLNAGLATNPDPKFQPDGLAPAAESPTRDLLKLTEADLRELKGASFSPVDGQYLAECFYLRDVVRAVDVAGLPPAVQADRAFAWVCRQVVLSPWVLTDPRTRESTAMPPVPPAFVLRRGSGSGLERGLVFLALAQQLGLDACLIGPPESADKSWTDRPNPEGVPAGPFWAVGVRVGADVFLFDPWRGEPLPGTLAAVKSSPDLLTPWREDKARPWTVPADVVAKSVPVLACPLPAVAPRFKRLEAELKEFSPVRLVADPVAARQRFIDQAKQPEVRFWNPGGDPFYPLRLLVGFLPTDEGGRPPNPELYPQFRESLTPFSVIQLPAAFDLREKENQLVPQPVFMVVTAARSRFNRLFWNGPLDTRESGPAVRMPSDPTAIKAFLEDPTLLERMEKARAGPAVMGETVLPLTSNPIPRERVQRGQHTEVRQYLVKSREELTKAVDRMRADRDREVKARDWVAKARQLITRLISAQERGSGVAEAQAALDEFHKTESNVIVQLIESSVAQAGMAEATYLLAGCMHELAERAQAKADRLAADPAKKSAAPAAQADAVLAWKEARDWWGRYQPFAADQDRSYPGRAAHAARMADRAAAKAGG